MISEALLAKTAKPLIDKLLSSIITPKIEQFANKCNVKYNELMIPKGEHFKEYLYRTFKKHSIINTLAFKNEQRLLKDLYIPLTLIKNGHQGRCEERIKIEHYPINLVESYSKILIADTAGMGKSTLTKYLFLDIVENGYGIPIYIEMRRLKKDRSILLEIQEQLSSLSSDFDEQLLLRFIQTGSFIFFLDGYDEISLEERSAVTTNVQDFISKANNNIFFLTSRLEQALSSFGDFQVFSINSLDKKEAYELLRKYDNQGNTSKRLIEELKTGQYEMINDFLKNPLLVSLLSAAFEYKNTIPLKKHIFYRQVYDAYFDSHDLSKGDSYIHDKYSRLDIDDFERVLRFIGFKCLNYQSIEFEKDVLLQIIDEAKTFCPDLKFSSSDFFTDILTVVPLFCNDGQYYKWVHKSLQEYFAAQFIYKDSKSNQEAILTALYNSKNIDKYINLLDLYYDIDNWGFKNNILFPLCMSYKEHYDRNIFTSDIISKQDIERRIGGLFLCESCLMKTKIDLESDIFQVANEYTKDYLKNKVSFIIHFRNDTYIFGHINPRHELISIIRKRLPELFDSSASNKSIAKISLPTDKTILIDMHTGDGNNDEYLSINSFLKGVSHYFNYEVCLRELENIKNIRKHKEKTSNLIEGL